MAARARPAWALALLALLLAAVVAVWWSPGDRPPGPVGARPSAGERRSAGGWVAEPTRGPSRERTGPDGDQTGGTIAGRVVVPELGPLSEGRLDVVCADGERLAGVGLTEEGGFVVPACAREPSCLRLVHPAVEQPEPWDRWRGGGEQVVELTAALGHGVAVAVVGPDGAPIADASLRVEQGGAVGTGRSDAVGEAFVSLPQPRPCDACDPPDARASCRAPGLVGGQPRATGEASLLAMASGFAPTEHQVVLASAVEPGEPVRIQLDWAAPALRGQVLDRDGSPFDARTRVLARHAERIHEQHAAQVDEHGEFRFDSLADADYSLRAIRDEREIASLASARSGERVALRSDLAMDGGRLTVEVLGDDGEPIAGVRVDGGPFRAAISDGDGRVEAAAVLPGAYTLRLRSAACPLARAVIELEPSSDGWTREVQLSERC